MKIINANMKYCAIVFNSFTVFDSSFNAVKISNSQLAKPDCNKNVSVYLKNAAN